MNPLPSVTIIGAGLAGSEAAWWLAEHGHFVRLFEMRPHVASPAHHSGDFAELVCSNSLKSEALTNAAGLLKAEMRQLGSLTMASAAQAAVPAGQALAVDRQLFSSWITAKIRAHPLIEVVEEEVMSLEGMEGPIIVASGPLTSPTFASFLQTYLGGESLYFYDAAAPLLAADSIDRTKVYAKSRYDKAGGDDYWNCPMTQAEFFAFYQALRRADRAPLHAFEREQYFEGCMPIEVLASRGPQTLTFGPMKPVGLEMSNGERPYAVVQLRQDDVAQSVYNMVGFQTNLKFGEQERVFRMIPGLEHARFLRYGVMHRNTYLNGPRLLDATLQLKQGTPRWFAGQMIGVEGYVESAASGIAAAMAVHRYCFDLPSLPLPRTTMLGALLHYVAHASPARYQPMNANFGLALPPTQDKQAVAERSLAALASWQKEALG